MLMSVDRCRRQGLPSKREAQSRRFTKSYDHAVITTLQVNPASRGFDVSDLARPTSPET